MNSKEKGAISFFASYIFSSYSISRWDKLLTFLTSLEVTKQYISVRPKLHFSVSVVH